MPCLREILFYKKETISKKEKELNHLEIILEARLLDTRYSKMKHRHDTELLTSNGTPQTIVSSYCNENFKVVEKKYQIDY